MEAGIVAAFGYWGYHTGTSAVVKVLLAVGVPVVGFGFWGAVDFHQAGRFSEALRLIQELVISGLAAVALYAAEQHVLGWVLASVSVVYHVLVYARGDRLLKKPQSPARVR
jgi:beta-xylosidase